MNAINAMSTERMSGVKRVRTTCPYCGVGCGVIASTEDFQNVSIAGDEEHPANYGRLCSKGSALGETLGPEGRLLYPEVHGERVAWGQALGMIASAFKDIIEQHGPDAIAFYVSGQLLTEDYYVANKLMKGFIGSANIDTNSRLCMSSSVAGHKRAFGADSVPGNYRDLETADLLVLVGSNAAWCHPVLWQRMLAAREARPEMRIVVIDPRGTDTTAGADVHLAIEPGADVALFNGLLVHLAEQGMADLAYVERHTQGYAAALAIAQAECPDLATTARRTGLAVAAIEGFFRLFAGTERVVTLYSQGVNQSSAGTDKVNAIINCHLATGRIGREGMGPFSLTGQPNAMGGREVGGLANQLAAHLELDNPHHRQWVQTFWSAPRMAERPGLKAVDLFEALATGRIKAIWVMATNPVVSLPDANAVRSALSQCPLVIVSDCVSRNDTLPFAHIRLPALGWLEKDGTVTNSERRISRQRALLPAPGEGKPDWWIVTEVARRMGYAPAFDYAHAGEIFAEHARLSAYMNAGQRDFDLSAWSDLDSAGYDGMLPTQWPIVRDGQGQAQGTERLCTQGRYFTPDQKARFIAVSQRAPVHAPSAAFPWVLNTGRVRDHWHTQTRTARSPRLTEHRDEPFLELHPGDAQQLGLSAGSLAAVQSRWGVAAGRVQLNPLQQPGSVFMPIHWSESVSSHGRIGALVNPVVDPISGQPELKHTPVDIVPLSMCWQAAGIVRGDASQAPKADYWVRVPGAGYTRYILAGQAALDLESAPSLLAILGLALTPEDEVLQFNDSGRQRTRLAVIRAGHLRASLSIQAAKDGLPDHRWQTWAYSHPEPLSPALRLAVIAGRSRRALPDPGRTVCACFGVGELSLQRAFIGGCHSVHALGQALKAGTNCGSCKPELGRLLANWQLAQASVAHAAEAGSVERAAPEAAALSQIR